MTEASLTTAPAANPPAEAADQLAFSATPSMWWRTIR